MPERNKIFTYYQHVKTKQVPLGEGIMNMMNMSMLDAQCLRQLILFAVSLLQDDMSLTENVLGLCGHHSTIC